MYKHIKYLIAVAARYRGGCRLWPLFYLLLTACGPQEPPAAPVAAAFDPLAYAASKRGVLNNREAPVPPACYTKTDGVSNPCWVCHTSENGWNRAGDVKLQEKYSFSDAALNNHWDNLFVDRSAQIAAISDEQALAYIRQDNYAPLRAALAGRSDYLGWKPDLDLHRGFDGEGFARDGSGWRAFRYKPFPGTFWPTNGSSDDVMIRLPRAFYTDAEGRESREVYRSNFAILESALTVGDHIPDAKLRRRTELISETLAGQDLNADGKIAGNTDLIRGLPAHYAGAAHDIAVRRWQYPTGTEFLHTLRYIEPSTPHLLSTRLKELRYAVKRQSLPPDAIERVYQEEKQKKTVGALPRFPGRADTGLLNELGWQLQAFIEDAQGRLRLQTDEEHYFCMGCHTNLGITVDQSFAFPRKPPGARGWGWQLVADIPDAPQTGQGAGQREGEYLSYFRRAGGGDEFRENLEIRARFWPGGVLDEAAVRAESHNITGLITPSRPRALALTKVYMALVREQRFDLGRDALLAPAHNVHRKIENGDTGLKQNQAVYADGRLWLEWGAD